MHPLHMPPLAHIQSMHACCLFEISHGSAPVSEISSQAVIGERLQRATGVYLRWKRQAVYIPAYDGAERMQAGFVWKAQADVGLGMCKYVDRDMSRVEHFK